MLAADSLYLLTSVFDWGPVALQHLLIAAGAYGWVRFFEIPREPRGLAWLAAGSFCWGLALWDKALAVWLLGGLALAAILSLGRVRLASIGKRGAIVAALAAALGALPLLLYNVHSHGATVRENAGWTASQLPRKAHMLEITATGQALLGYFNAEDRNTPAPHAVPKWVADVPKSYGSLLPWAFGLALLLTPLGGTSSRKGVVFCAIALAAAWLAMAVNPNAGGAVHHTILLWPLPQAVIAISLAAASRRFGVMGAVLASAATVVLCLSSLLVTADYYREMTRNGGTPNWSAAVFPMAESLRHSGADEVYAMDWGILDTVRLLNHNWPLMRNGVEGLNEHDITVAGHLFVTHAEGAVVMPEVEPKVVAQAAALGYRQETVGAWNDGFGRDVFIIYKWTKRGD